MVDIDLFQIKLESQFESKHDWIIINFYQPIIGLNATSLFLTLKSWSLCSGTLSSTDLLSVLNINKDELFIAKQKLEAAKLLKVYRYKRQNLVKFFYKLLLPLTSEDLFANSELTTLINKKIGQEKYSILKQKYFETFEFDAELEEITGKLDFIDLNENVSQVSNTKNDNIDFLLSKLAELYELDDNQKDEIIELSIISNDDALMIDSKILAEKARQISQTKKSMKPLNFREFKSLIIEAEKNSTGIDVPELKKQLKLLSPVNLLEETLKVKLSISDYKILELLFIEYDFNFEMVNMILEYVCFKNNGILQENYVKKIAKTISESSMDTEECINYFVKLINSTYLTKKKLFSKKTNKNFKTGRNKEFQRYVVEYDEPNPQNQVIFTPE